LTYINHLLHSVSYQLFITLNISCFSKLSRSSGDGGARNDAVNDA
jgi:hypothetical protein